MHNKRIKKCKSRTAVQSIGPQTKLINLIRTKKLLFSILKNSDIEKVVTHKTIEARRDMS